MTNRATRLIRSKLNSSSRGSYLFLEVCDSRAKRYSKRAEDVDRVEFAVDFKPVEVVGTVYSLFPSTKDVELDIIVAAGFFKFILKKAD